MGRLMPYPSGERGATVAAEVPHTKRGSMYRGSRDVARLCATGLVMLAAMPTDAATETVEHVRDLASERRVVFGPAELIDDLARIGERRFVTLLGDGHVPRHWRLARRLTFLRPPGGGGCPRRPTSTAEEDLGVHAQR
jgi:hypothetical protein